MFFSLSQLCDFQSVLSTEDEKKIRHLDHLYEVRHVFNYCGSLSHFVVNSFSVLFFILYYCIYPQDLED